jgi:acyl-CoA dehydrogenase
MDCLEQFRHEVRAWLEANCPPSMRIPMPQEETVWGGRKTKNSNADAKLWLDRMAAKGWTAPTWPKEYGGGALSSHEARVLQEELDRINARPALTSFGISMLGPVLLECGTEPQKREHIPKIVRGEIRWCQGYSEPGAGSDLAGLQTRAVDMGDHYVVNGSKIWTSYADKADWMFCLVRTDPDAPKHKGISFLLFDMETPGVSTRPIRLISGESPFCQTFLDDVKVPKENLLGTLNDGWSIAKKLLQHEPEEPSWAILVASHWRRRARSTWAHCRMDALPTQRCGVASPSMRWMPGHMRSRRVGSRRRRSKDPDVVSRHPC